jgi:SAM-dependent methyltransferase
MGMGADGYFTGSGYTLEFYRQATPVWLRFAALLCGHRAPPLERPFRWVDLGCGQGLTALFVAAAHPGAEICAFDFDPGHVDHAATLARAAGLANVTAEAVAFAELAVRPAQRDVDFIALHGVWSWVSAAQRQHIITYIDRNLAPGGLVYVSYNTLAGWAAMLPVQRYLYQYGQAHPGPAAAVLAGAMAQLEAAEAGGAAFFRDNPTVAARLADMRRMAPRYLAHEFLHAHWMPSDFAEVATAMAQARCAFVGSATLLDNFAPFVVPPGMAALGDEVTPLAEALRDFGGGQTLRRDIFRRGGERPPAGEITRCLDEMTLFGMGVSVAEDFSVQTRYGARAVLEPGLYQPLAARLEGGTLPLAELRAALTDASALPQIAAVLAAAGLAHPELPGAPGRAAAMALNKAIGRANADGATIDLLAAPVLGSAVPKGRDQIFLERVGSGNSAL